MKQLFIIIVIFTCQWNVFSQEVQIPFDKEGKIRIIDQKLNEKLSYFNNYKGFKDALLFQVNDSSYLLEISYMPDKQMLRERKALTPIEKESLLLEINNSINQKAPEYSVDQEGRTTLIVSSTVGGLSIYAPSLISIFRMNDRPAIATYMLTVGASFVVPFYLTRKEPVSVASAWLGIYGESRGFIHGMALSSLFDADERTSLGISMCTSIGEGTMGYFYARNNRLTAGQASAYQIYGDASSVLGILIAGSSGLYDNNVETDKKIAATYLVSNFAGLALAKYVTSKNVYDTGDGYVSLNSGILGALSTFTIVYYFEPDEIKVYTSLIAAGGIGGLYLGNYYAKNYDYTMGQGLLTLVGSVAGGLIGTGLGILATDEMDSKLILTTSTIGGWGGFIAMKHIFNKNNKLVSNNYKLKINLGAAPILGLSNANTINASYKIAPTLNLSLKF